MAAAKRYEELTVWQLSRDLRDGVLRVMRSGSGAGDWKFVGQIADAAASAPRNIAEGFGHFTRGNSPGSCASRAGPCSRSATTCRTPS
jgi:23S rRNA-intervening sequence protein